MKTIRIKFLDGAFSTFRNVLEYTSGRMFFFFAQQYEENKKTKIEIIGFKRSDIIVVERKIEDGGFVPVSMKKIKG